VQISAAGEAASAPGNGSAAGAKDG
jgi:hypothetical protein